LSKCGGKKKIIAFIEDYRMARKLPDCLGIYELRRHSSLSKNLIQLTCLMTKVLMIIYTVIIKDNLREINFS